MIHYINRMVKNTGGNKSKRQGRKYVTAPQQRSVRYKKEEDESYAVVTKLFGGPNCEVMCMDGIIRHCIIRNKFRGRDKKDNTIAPNVWVLVGIRTWEARTNKPQKSDLLAVYSANDKEKLRDTLGENEILHLLKANDEKVGNHDSDIVFAADNTEMDTHSDSLAIENEATEQTEQTEDDDGVIDIDEI